MRFFDRYCELSIGIAGTIAKFKYQRGVGPTIDFQINRTLGPRMDTGDISISLPEDGKASRIIAATTASEDIPFELIAGYEEGHGTIMKGQIIRAKKVELPSQRGAAFPLALRLEVADGYPGYRRGQIQLSSQLSTVSQLTNRVIAELKGTIDPSSARTFTTAIGKVTKSTFDNAVVYQGRPTEILTDICRSLKLTWRVENDVYYFYELYPQGQTVAQLGVRQFLSLQTFGNVQIDEQDQQLSVTTFIDENLRPGSVFRLPLLQKGLRDLWRAYTCVFRGSTEQRSWAVDVTADKVRTGA